LLAAKRSAQKKVHPDVSKLNPVESTARTAAVNAAFEVLNARIR
jgi:curved DNA-binding protein CbpA